MCITSWVAITDERVNELVLFQTACLLPTNKVWEQL